MKTKEISLSWADMTGSNIQAPPPVEERRFEVPRSRPFTPSNYLDAEGYRFVVTKESPLKHPSTVFYNHIFEDAQGVQWILMYDPTQSREMFRGKPTEEVSVTLRKARKHHTKE